MRWKVCHPVGFPVKRTVRAILRLTDGRWCLAKGMLFINPFRERDVALRESCSKLYWQESFGLTPGFDFTQDSRWDGKKFRPLSFTSII